MCDPDDAGAGTGRHDTAERAADAVRLRAAETELARSRAHARAVLDTVVDAVVTIDRHGTVIAFNHAAERIFGYAAAEMIGASVNRLMPDAHAARHDGYLARYLRTGERRIIGVGREIEGRRSDGSLFPMELAVSESRVDGERFFIGLVHDISRRRGTEERLRQREEQLRLTVEHAPLGIATSGPDRRLIDVNPAFCTMLGRDREALVGAAEYRWLVPEDRVRAARLSDELWAGRRHDYTLELRYQRANGGETDVRLYATTVHDAGGRPLMAVTMAQDRTAQRRAEDEARQLRERLAHVSRLSTLGEMATGIAHEINQPLTAIASYARACHRLVEGGVGEPRELLDTLDKIAAQAQRAGEVIRRLRGFIRKRESRREPCDLNALVDDVIQLAEIDASRGDFAIVTRLAPRPLSVEADPIQIQQVLLNLIRNAMEAMSGVAAADEAVTVIVATSADRPDTAHVSVRDRGGGVESTHAEQLFSPFFSTKPGGMGMGLSISRSIIASHGGRLWFEPNDDGVGVTMHFALPLLAEDESRDGADERRD